MGVFFGALLKVFDRVWEDFWEGFTGLFFEGCFSDKFFKIVFPYNIVDASKGLLGLLSGDSGHAR